MKIIGSLGQTTNGARISEEAVQTPLKLGELLLSLEQRYGLELRRDSILAMVNGVEARALQDLETLVMAEDEIVLIPMFHGG